MDHKDFTSPPEGYENAPASVRRARLMRMKAADEKAVFEESRSPDNTLVKIVKFLMIMNALWAGYMLTKFDLTDVHYPVCFILFGALFIFIFRCL